MDRRNGEGPTHRGDDGEAQKESGKPPSSRPDLTVQRTAAIRERLPNRRTAESFGLACEGLTYTATIGRFADGRPAEIFLRNHKATSAADAMAKDSAVLCSIALQHGVPIDTIRHALLRDSRGVASSPLGVALDLIAGGGQ
jgi:hypothetical protein